MEAYKTKKWRPLPIAKRLAIVFLLLSSDWTVFARGEYRRLYRLPGGLIAGFESVVNVGVVILVIVLVRGRPRPASHPFLPREKEKVQGID